MTRSACLLALSVPLALVVSAPRPRPATGQTPARPTPQTYHWVLPVQHTGVDVATLHPHDCYVVERAQGRAYFGEPPPGVAELQRQLSMPVAHVIETTREHPECLLESCLNVDRITHAIERTLTESGEPRLLRRVDHQPTPVDSTFGGAYTDVGSEERVPFRNGLEQRMIYLHLGTARRSNCYDAKAPRVLSIHVRDFEVHANRTGVYRGFLYIEHHHPSSNADTVASNRGGAVRAPRLVDGLVAAAAGAAPRTRHPARGTRHPAW